MTAWLLYFVPNIRKTCTLSLFVPITNWDLIYKAELTYVLDEFGLLKTLLGFNESVNSAL